MATVVEGDPKAPFLIATTFPGLLHFTLDTYLKMLISLFYLFNGILTFVGYFMPKILSLKNSSGIIQPIRWEDKGGSYLSQGYLPESERNSATGVRTRLLRFNSPSL